MDKNSTVWGTPSMVCGILGLVLFLAPYIAIILSICAIVFYALQKKRKLITRATAGLVCGIIGVCVNLVMLVIVLVALMIGL